jgi:hypothetical protein
MNAAVSLLDLPLKSTCWDGSERLSFCDEMGKIALELLIKLLAYGRMDDLRSMEANITRRKTHIT